MASIAVTSLFNGFVAKIFRSVTLSRRTNNAFEQRLAVQSENAQPAIVEMESMTANELFALWFEENPGAKNPTDINTLQKYEFAKRVGWDNLRKMNQARKANTAKNGYPNPWTKADYYTAG